MHVACGESASSEYRQIKFGDNWEVVGLGWTDGGINVTYGNWVIRVVVMPDILGVSSWR